jgi:hypothetical protein
MRYAQGGGLTVEGRRRREQVRLAAVEKFEQRIPSAVIADELRVSERSVQRWRLAWEAGGAPGLASKGQAARCRGYDGFIPYRDHVIPHGERVRVVVDLSIEMEQPFLPSGTGNRWQGERST